MGEGVVTERGAPGQGTSFAHAHGNKAPRGWHRTRLWRNSAASPARPHVRVAGPGGPLAVGRTNTDAAARSECRLASRAPRRERLRQRGCRASTTPQVATQQWLGVVVRRSELAVGGDRTKGKRKGVAL